ncbi:cyclic nucleotide-binding domain-containing protein [Archangium lipolyticum]|uniref:cyclic nucleotide-binding domain-containing protein n=1 Tax=Archangium lipolyticum TaxID=2970465 RepID=UPI002149DB2C|nr:cyclic nucleotide-binding domain-containing protein [Archangium lipolyticum]
MALTEFRRLESEGRTQEALAGYEGLAKAWAHGSQLLRAIVACKALSRLGPAPLRIQSLIASLYARQGVSPSNEGTGPLSSAELESLLERENPALSVPIFSMLDRDAFVALLDAVEVRTFAAGQTVVREGEPGASMVFMAEGRADIVRTLEDGSRQAGPSVVEGGAFGELTLLVEGPRSAGLVAAVPSVLLELTRERLVEVAGRHPLLIRVVEAFCRRRAVDNLLRTHPMFSLLPYEQQRVVAREFRLQRVEAGTTLLTAGATGDAVYLLLRGRCTPYHVHPDGHETPYPVLREGDVLGEISLLLDKPVTAMVRADVQCLLLRLDRSACERHIFSQPGMRDALMRIGAERLRRTARVLAERSLPEGDPGL